jgi:hypothetical protein
VQWYALPLEVFNSIGRIYISHRQLEGDNRHGLQEHAGKTLQSSYRSRPTHSGLHTPTRDGCHDGRMGPLTRDPAVAPATSGCYSHPCQRTSRRASSIREFVLARSTQRRRRRQGQRISTIIRESAPLCFDVTQRRSLRYHTRRDHHRQSHQRTSKLRDRPTPENGYMRQIPLDGVHHEEHQLASP